jgi:F-type H+-transporting ATPase subunit b
LILFPVIKFFFLTPLQDAIQERTQSLEATFAEAESLRKEMQTMRSDYEQRLVATEANARDQIQAQIREAQTLRSSLMAEAAQRADELVARAQQEIEAEKQKAITEIRMQVVDLTLLASERVLGENMDNDRNRRLVSEFIDKVEVPV